MSQNRRRPQADAIAKPEDASAQQRLLQLVPHTEVKAPDRAARLATEVMHFLRTNGFDCSVVVEAAEDETHTLH